MNISQLLTNGMNKVLRYGNGVQVNLVNYFISGNDYDDVLTTQVIVGSSWVSGVEFGLDTLYGSNLPVVLQQGKLLHDDRVVYLPGNTNLSGSGLLIGIGSPVDAYYTVIPNGVHIERIAGSNIYTELFLRQTIPGSLF